MTSENMKYHIDFDVDFKRNSYPGKLIAIEGIDGSGKTTQVEKVAEILSGEQKVFVTKNPTDGPVGQFIRKVLSKEIELPSVSFQYLFSADRQVQQVEILERLKQGEIVITDRYFWSALAYGLVDRGAVNFDENGNFLLISQGILSMYHQFIVPDKTFYLKISPDEAMKRLSEMDKEKELYEQKEKLEDIYRAYEWLFKKFPEEITVVDGAKGIEDISRVILKTLDVIPGLTRNLNVVRS